MSVTGKEYARMKDLTNRVQYYYDSHPTEEDLMGETTWHATLVDYLKAVLIWLFHGQAVGVYDNLNFYQTYNPKEYPVAPDLAIIKGTPFHHMRSWAVGRGEPVPQVVFEILSEETWKKDLREKPAKYASLGVLEYFAYDPNDPPVSREAGRRLWGWKLDARRGVMVELTPTPSGWLWSEQLESWLVPDQTYLRLYDREHQLRLTGEEAQAQRADIQAEQAEEAREEAEEAREEAEEARKRAEIAEERAEEAIRMAQALAEKLRALGINPDKL
jgi:Uma2 family endonuclease